jgi:hypothetical protein
VSVEPAQIFGSFLCPSFVRSRMSQADQYKTSLCCPQMSVFRIVVVLNMNSNNPRPLYSAPNRLRSCAPFFDDQTDPSFDEPTESEDCTQELIELAVSTLCDLVIEGEWQEHGIEVLVLSSSRTQLEGFVAGLLSKSHCPNECVPLAIRYLRRLAVVSKTHLLRENICVTFTTALILASKWLEDDGLAMSVFCLVLLSHQHKLTR